MNKYETVKFNNDSVEIDVTVSPLEDTVWLSQEQMALLFNVNVPAVNKHIKNILFVVQYIIDLFSCQIKKFTIYSSV